MSDLPMLIVDGDPTDWLTCGYEHPTIGQCPPDRDTVRIDDDLPTVTDPDDIVEGEPWGRTLRAGDRVTLATQDHEHPNGGRTKTRPFATATVADIDMNTTGTEWLITVTKVEAL